MEGLLIVVIIVLVIIVFLMSGTNRRLDTNIQLLNKSILANQRTFDASTEQAVADLLNNNSAKTAEKIAREKFGITEDEFTTLYYKLNKEKRLRFKIF